MNRASDRAMKSHTIGAVFALTWASLCTGFVGSASGQTQPVVAPVVNKDESLADRYFFEAKARAAEQDWEAAYQLLEKAWELKPSHDIAGNLGQVALKLGRYKKAATFLDRCLRLFPPTGNASQRAQIQSLYESARSHVAAVRLHLAPQPGELLLDRVTALGTVSEHQEPIFVDPGTHVVQIRRDGRVVVDQAFVAVANAVQDVTLAQSDNSNTSPNVATQSPAVEAKSALPGTLGSAPPATQQRSKLPVLIGATVAVGGFVSGALLVDSANHQVAQANGFSDNHAKNFCSLTRNSPECQGLYENNARADARYNWGHAMLGVGAAALVATGTYLLWPTREPSEAKDHSGKAGATLSVGYAPGQGMISWLGQF